MVKWAVAAGLAVLLLWVCAAAALSPEEVIRLKKAGVSDQTIQLMLEQEAAGGGGAAGPVQEGRGEVVYRAGSGVREEMQRNREHERWKEEKSLEALKGVIIDTRSGR